MTRLTFRTELDELVTRLESSPARQTTLVLNRIAHARLVFERNYDELEAEVDKFTAIDFARTLFADSKVRDDYLLEVTRLLHNLMASVGTLIDHTRRTMRDLYADTDFLRDYQAHVDGEFAQNSLANFVQDLRNYTLHRELPLPEGRLRANPAEARSYLHLNRGVLQEWDGWSKAGRTYLESSSDDIELGSILATYAALVLDLYTWLAERQSELHKDDLDEVARLRSDIRAFMNR